MTLPLGIGSTFEAAGAADKIRDEIAGLFRDGTLAATMAKYSYYGLDDTWATYDLMSAIERARWSAWVMSAIAAGLTLALWQTFALRQRKRSERKLRESEERFRRVFEEGPLGVALVGKDHRFLKVNSALCQMVGYDEPALVRMSFVDITHPDDVQADVELADQLFRREIPFYRIQKRYVKKTGDVIWINLTASMILGSDGEPLHGLAMIEDITEIKRTQDEALFRQKLESVGTVAGWIAHDFNNLLGAVQAQAELAAAELDAGSSCKEELQAIREVATRGSEIVRQLMIYAGKESAVVGPVDLSKTVAEMLSLLKVSVTKRALIKASLDQDLPPILASDAQVRQIVMNLITNASDAIGEKDGVIQLSTSRVRLEQNGTPNWLPAGDYVRLEASDTGCGMTEETKAKIFDPFFSTKFAGRGLGLAAVQGIVRSHGGSINVVSSPGQGARFEILLPCSSNPVGQSSSATQPATSEETTRLAGTVLIVEDEERIRSSISALLRKNGFTVIEAADGQRGIDLFRANAEEIDIVLLDMSLPVYYGHEVLRELRQIRPDVNVAITSAYGENWVRNLIGEQQHWHFIRKPYGFSEVMKLIRSTLCERTGTAPKETE
jgi:PAS domain S-box-containing protein